MERCGEIMMPWITPPLVPELKDLFLKYGKTEYYKKGEVLVREYESVKKVFYLKEGFLYSAIMDFCRSKSYVCSGIHFPTSTCSNTGFMVEKFVPLRITALKSSEVKVLKSTELEFLFCRDQRLKIEFIYHSYFCLKTCNDAMLVRTLMTAADRIKSLLVAVLHWFGCDMSGEYVCLPVGLTRAFIGKATYISAKTVDRIFADWSRDGVIRPCGAYRELRIADFMDTYKWLESRTIPGI